MAATLSPPQIIPTTEAPFQAINVTLGGQDCLINLYTKSFNVVVEDPGTIPPTPIVMASFTGSLSGGVLTVGDDVTGTILVENVLAGAGVALPTYVVKQLTGTPGLAGTYSVTPAATAALGPIPMTTSFAQAPTYENINPVFLDLYSPPGTLIIGGVICYNECLIIINEYLGFIGDLAMIDTQGNADPFGTPLRLPPPDLRNWWQRNLPLSLGGKMPVSSANRIPGLGSRFLLTYWPNLK